ncbi:helix-turn-helix domain-containing protein [Salipaludibacillus agaradhaerens]|uniref:helix-turn-helix domain-containing protein n=1 Tax=Salipaludibacillus agaradhaerens TaxID=76935 RepID=UPI00117CCC2F|nr:helix-turn-helix domain-containing protein [Salipaludibacillus agaradhaerens]
MKLIIFGCLISIVPVVFIGTFSYVQSTNEIQEKVNEEKIQSMQQVNSNVEQILTTVNFTLNRIIDSAVMEHSLRRSMIAEDFQIHRDLRKELVNLQSMETRVEDITILNFERDWLMNNRGISRLDEHPDSALYISFLDMPNNSSWELLEHEVFEEPISSGSCTYSLSLVKKLPTFQSNKFGLAFANIPTCTIADMIFSDNSSEEFMIVNHEFDIIVHPDEEMIGQSLLNSNYVSSLTPFEEEKTGQFNTTIHDEPYTITYHTSDFNDWTYLSIMSINELTAESKSIGWMTILVTSLMIVMSLITVFIISRRLYSPLQRVMRQIEYHLPTLRKNETDDLTLLENQVTHLFSSKTTMEVELLEHKKQVKVLFMNRLYQGIIKPSDLEEKLAYFNLNDMTAKWRRHVVLTIKLDCMEESVYEAADRELLSFAMMNVAEESVRGIDHLPVVWVNKSLVILIGFTEEESDIQMNSTIYKLTEQLQDNIETCLYITVSIGISLPFVKLLDASRAYQEGLEALKHRITLGKGVIVHYETINSGKHTLIYEYPQRAEEELILAIKVADKTKALAHLKAWMSKVFKDTYSPREYHISMMRLLNNLLLIKQENSISFQEIDVEYDALYEELLTIHMKEDIEKWFKTKLICPLIEIFSKRRESQFQNISEKMMDLIHKHYDTNITLEEYAEKMHYNANYLSSVFKQETNYTFSEYLAKYRFKKAKQWLIETNMTVKEIADKLQYKNSQNFIRSFKKLENMTPGQYRKEYSRVS